MSRLYILFGCVSVFSCKAVDDAKVSIEAPLTAPTAIASRTESTACDTIGKVTRRCGYGGIGYANHPSIEGRGLEFRHFKARAKSSAVLPPAAGTILDEVRECEQPSKPLSVRVMKCSSETKQAFRCVVDVVSEGNGICHATDRAGNLEQREQTTKERGVMLLGGYWDQKGNWIDQPDVVTLSCDASGGWDQAISADGAITACLQAWRYDPRHHRDELLSCVRALRADYCGDGISHTLPGTDLDIHDKSNHPMTTEQCEERRAFEASWSPSGAVCLAHARYEESGLGQCDQDFGPPDASGIRCRIKRDSEILFSRSRCNTCMNGRVLDRECAKDLEPLCGGRRGSAPEKK